MRFHLQAVESALPSDDAEVVSNEILALVMNFSVFDKQHSRSVPGLYSSTPVYRCLHS